MDEYLRSFESTAILRSLGSFMDRAAIKIHNAQDVVSTLAAEKTIDGAILMVYALSEYNAVYQNALKIASLFDASELRVMVTVDEEVGRAYDIYL